jgi:SAM-dependent methyltransferase
VLRVPDRARSDLEGYEDTYREAVSESIAFSGADLDLFTRIKADLLVDLARAVGEPERLAFLDVGCGPGETDRFLEGRVGSLAGVDVVPGMVKRAGERNPWAEYRVYGEGEPIPCDDGAFDVCFAICVLHHVLREQRAALVTEMKRVCRPGGLIALFEHNPLNPLTRKAVHGCEFDRDAELLGRREALDLLRTAGLVPRHRYIEFFPRDSGLLRMIEARLCWLPLGAQYVVFAQRP